MFNTKYNTLGKNNSWKGAIQLLRSHLEGKWESISLIRVYSWTLLVKLSFQSSMYILFLLLRKKLHMGCQQNLHSFFIF